MGQDQGPAPGARGPLEAHSGSLPLPWGPPSPPASSALQPCRCALSASTLHERAHAQCEGHAWPIPTSQMRKLSAAPGLRVHAAPGCPPPALALLPHPLPLTHQLAVLTLSVPQEQARHPGTHGAPCWDGGAVTVMAPWTRQTQDAFEKPVAVRVPWQGRSSRGHCLGGGVGTDRQPDDAAQPSR